MLRNGILHTVNNSDAGLITSWLSGWPMDRHTACTKNNNKYKLAVVMVNVLGCRDDQCTKYATLTTSAEKLRKHGEEFMLQ
jgi:hypothetical protein